jgi:hypothetical protein
MSTIPQQLTRTADESWDHAASALRGWARCLLLMAAWGLQGLSNAAMTVQDWMKDKEPAKA